MAFTETERKNLGHECDYVQSKIDEVKRNPSLLSSYPIEEYPHIWKRFETLKAMTRDELMQEIEADYVLVWTDGEKYAIHEVI